LALSPNGFIKSKNATGHPSTWEKLKTHEGHSIYKSKEEATNGPRVVYDSENNLLTSVGPGSAVEFGVEIVRKLKGDKKAKEIEEIMMMVPKL